MTLLRSASQFFCIVSLIALPMQGKGGPGISGGNPRATIANAVHDYSFRSSMPSAFQMTNDTSVYTFGGGSYEVMVKPVKPSICKSKSIEYKTICADVSRDGRVGKFVMCWASTSFWVEVRSNLLSRKQKEASLENVLLSFHCRLFPQENLQ